MCQSLYNRIGTCSKIEMKEGKLTKKWHKKHFGSKVNKFPLVEGILRTTGFYKLFGLHQIYINFSYLARTFTKVCFKSLVHSGQYFYQGSFQIYDTHCITRRRRRKRENMEALHKKHLCLVR